MARIMVRITNYSGDGRLRETMLVACERIAATHGTHYTEVRALDAGHLVYVTVPEAEGRVEIEAAA